MPSAEITSCKPTSDYRSACPYLDYFQFADSTGVKACSRWGGRAASRASGWGRPYEGWSGCAPTDTPRPSQQACLPST